MTTARPRIGVLDADTYANGDPTTFGLPLEQYRHLRDEEPCYRYEFNDPILIDRAWVVSRNADIWAVDRNSELYSADRGYVNMWKVAVINPEPGEHLRGKVEDAVLMCPVAAIGLED
jgi:cholest-4-en-3-one 26-monooxygenase